MVPHSLDVYMYSLTVTHKHSLPLSVKKTHRALHPHLAVTAARAYQQQGRCNHREQVITQTEIHIVLNTGTFFQGRNKQIPLFYEGGLCHCQ